MLMRRSLLTNDSVGRTGADGQDNVRGVRSSTQAMLASAKSRWWHRQIAVKSRVACRYRDYPSRNDSGVVNSTIRIAVMAMNPSSAIYGSWKAEQ